MVFKIYIAIRYEEQKCFQGSVKVKWSESDIRPSMVTHTRNLCSAFNPSKVHTDSSEHTPMFTFCSHFCPFLVLYSVVQCIVGCILYNKQIVWPWTLCFPFDNSTDCSIDFDWLQVHINKEQNYSLTETKDKFVRCRIQYCKNRGTSWRKNKKNSKEQSRVVISDQFWATMLEHVFVHQ